MKKVLAAFGASALAFGLMGELAEAKTIQYEINGKSYAYDSTKPQEIAVARKLIEAANAADKATAIAAEERARNPLVAIFGSEAQQNALAARAHLERVLAEEPGAALSAAVEQPSRQAASPAADADRKEPRKEVLAKRAEPAAAPQAEIDSAGKAQPTESAAEPKMQSVFLDPESGIKTTFMADGSIREELADPAVLTKDGAGDGMGHLARQHTHDGAAETTGSTTRHATDPAP
jgi:hypothetical protein